MPKASLLDHLQAETEPPADKPPDTLVAGRHMRSGSAALCPMLGTIPVCSMHLQHSGCSSTKQVAAVNADSCRRSSAELMEQVQQAGLDRTLMLPC